MKIVSVVLFALLLPGCSTLFMVSTASNYLVDKCGVPIKFLTRLGVKRNLEVSFIVNKLNI